VFSSGDGPLCAYRWSVVQVYNNMLLHYAFHFVLYDKFVGFPQRFVAWVDAVGTDALFIYVKMFRNKTCYGQTVFFPHRSHLGKP